MQFQCNMNDQGHELINDKNDLLVWIERKKQAGDKRCTTGGKKTANGGFLLASFFSFVAVISVLMAAVKAD